MKTNIEIAQAAKCLPIEEAAAKIGLSKDDLQHYGKYTAKVPLDVLSRFEERPNGKLIVTTAITPTPAGEGKTVTTIGLVQGLGKLNKRVIGALTQVGALHLREKPPYHLSGGEKKRVAIATVLAMAPSVLVMDEPTTGLDPFARRRLIGLIRDFDHTRILTSHDLDMVLDLCERVIVLHEGKVRADGPAMSIFNDEALLAECRLVAQQRVVVVDRAQRERIHGADCSCYHLVASPHATS